ncbi:MAG: LysR substrate-binding domain-containing protein [Polyangiales bacterium]
MRPKVSENETLSGDLADLRAFCLAGDLGSITAASRAMGESKGATSRRVARLERALGAALLRRGARRVSLTEEGVGFRERAGRALETLDEAAAELWAGRAEPRGVLRLTAPTDLGNLIAPVVASFIDAHPAVRVEVELSQATLDFEAHRIDVAFRAAATLRDSPLIAHRLVEMSLALFASPGYLARHGAPATPDALSAHRLVRMPYGGRAPRLTLRRGDELAPLGVASALLANDNTFTVGATVAGAGVGLLLEAHAEADLAAGRLVRVLEDWRLVERGALFLLHADAALLPAKVRAFRDHALRALRRPEAARVTPRSAP